jgi:hypothetical protein
MYHPFFTKENKVSEVRKINNDFGDSGKKHIAEKETRGYNKCKIWNVFFEKNEEGMLWISLRN